MALGYYFGGWLLKRSEYFSMQTLVDRRVGTLLRCQIMEGSVRVSGGPRGCVCAVV